MTVTKSQPFGDLRTNAEKIADEHVKEAVLRGIELLEMEVGPDWVDRIDPRTLILSDGTYCVCGQVFAEDAERDGEDNGYDWACENVFGRTDPDLLGFTTNSDDWTPLTNAWRTALGYPPVDHEPRPPSA